MAIRLNPNYKYPKISNSATFWAVRDKVSGFYYEGGGITASIWPELDGAKTYALEQSAKTLARKCNKNKHFDCDTWEAVELSVLLSNPNLY